MSSQSEFYREGIQQHAVNYMSHENFQVLMGTWNVNAKLGDTKDIERWLIGALSEQKPDIIVVGLQEMISLSPSSVITSTVVTSLSSSQATKWCDMILSVLNDVNAPHNYDFVVGENMVGLWIGMFVDTSVVGCVKELAVSHFETGNGGYLGNKGAVAIRLKLFDSSVCFVNAHFAANQGNVQQRNNDYHAILNKCTFEDSIMKSTEQMQHGTPSAGMLKLREKINSMNKRVNAMQEDLQQMHKCRLDGIDDMLPPPPCGMVNEELKTFAVCDHDVIFWMGDLNYRLSDNIDMSTAMEKINSNASYDLLYDDQLLIEKDADEIFHNFHEGMLTFDPTYKFFPGTNNYDTRTEKKVRVPSWCDRILWRVGKRSRKTQLHHELIRKRVEQQKEFYEKYCDLNNSENTNDVQLKIQQELMSLYDKQLKQQQLMLQPAEPIVEVVELMSYDSVVENLISDHKPVRGIYNMRVKR